MEEDSKLLCTVLVGFVMDVFLKRVFVATLKSVRISSRVGAVRTTDDAPEALHSAAEVEEN